MSLKLDLLDRAVLWVRQHEALMSLLPTLSIFVTDDAATIGLGFFHPGSEILKSIVDKFAGLPATLTRSPSSNDFRVINHDSGLQFVWHVWVVPRHPDQTEEVII